jgi:NADH-quinone oxidoreductase subunit N
MIFTNNLKYIFYSFNEYLFLPEISLFIFFTIIALVAILQKKFFNKNFFFQGFEKNEVKFEFRLEKLFIVLAVLSFIWVSVLLGLQSYFIDFNEKIFFFNSFFFLNIKVIISKFFFIILNLNLLILFYKKSFNITFYKIRLEGLFLIYLLCLIGFFFLSSFNLLFIFINLESINIITYCLIAFNFGNINNIEATLKYFLLNVYASMLLILSFVILYSYSGSLNLLDIYLNLNYNLSLDFINQVVGLNIGLLLLVLGFLFKLGIIPFHFLILQIYPGLSWINLIFISIIPKFLIINLFLDILKNIFINSNLIIGDIFIFILLLALLLSSILAIFESNLKRLMLFSSINNIAIILLPTLNKNLISDFASQYYLYYYISISFVLFFIFSLIEKNGLKGDFNLNFLYDLVKIIKINKNLGFILVILVFILSGLPPFIGFFAKFYILLSLTPLTYEFYIVLLSSFISMIYYLKIIRFLIFKSRFEENILASNINLLEVLMIYLYSVLFFIYIIYSNTFLNLLLYFNI